MRSTFSDSDSPVPRLRERAILAAVRGGLWSRVRVVPETGSTNADLLAIAASDPAEGQVLIAESQRAGRGRMGRAWQAPPRAGLTMSVLLRPRGVPAARLGWLPLLAGVAVARACADLPGVDAALKWPNDLLVRPAAAPGADGLEWGKCGGILAEAADGAVVIGIGINVSQQPADLPAPPDPAAYPATSLAVAGAAADRERLAVAVLSGLADWYGRWLAAAGEPAGGLAEAYRTHCATLGREVKVTLPGRGSLAGTATGIDPDGRLVIVSGTGEHHLAAGDVQHLRAAPTS